MIECEKVKGYLIDNRKKCPYISSLNCSGIMKKLLIITYYWPPSGDVGVHRPLKFAKYLPQFDWQPIIYTAETKDFTFVDASLSKNIAANTEVVRTKIWEPYQWYAQFTGAKKKKGEIQNTFLQEEKKKSWTKAFAIWVRGNFFIPDARCFWLPTSIKHLTKYIETNQVDAILSTGPPHTVHLIARQLKRKFNIPWIADFRDPWTQIDYYKDLKLTKVADSIHRKLEKSVLQEADQVLTVSWNWAKAFEKLGAKKEVAVITNGYDTSDFTFDTKPQLDTKFTISHVGLLNKDRNPTAFWTALASLCAENPTFKQDLVIQLIGKVDYRVIEIIKEKGLQDNLVQKAYIPHKEITKVYAQSQVLLLIINQVASSLGRIPAKLFEYLAAKRPILCISPKSGDAVKIVSETKTGTSLLFEDMEGIKAILEKYYTAFTNNTLYLENTKIEQYSRYELTKQLSKLLGKL